jgi:hypothetical protein
VRVRSEQPTVVEGGPVLVGHLAGSPQFHAAFEEEYRLHRMGRGMWLRYIGVALLSSILTFAITWGVASSRPVTVRLATASDIAAAAAATNANAAANSNNNAAASTGAASKITNKVAASAANTGQVALTESQLRATVKTIGGSIYWAGSLKNAKYTLNHISAGQDFVRYLPNGKGLNDVTQNYRVIATYKDPNAYETVVAASKLTAGVTKTNPDGSFIFYAKDTPTHVYLVYKNVPYQIEIFDPIPGESLKMATTPGIISAIF